MKSRSSLLFLIVATTHYCSGHMEAQTLTNILNRVSNYPTADQKRCAASVPGLIPDSLMRGQLTDRGIQVLAIFAQYHKETGLPAADLKKHVLYSLLADSPSFYQGASAARYPKKTTCLQGHNAGIIPWGEPNERYNMTYFEIDKALTDEIAKVPASPTGSQNSGQKLLAGSPLATVATTTGHKKLNITTGIGLTVTTLGLMWLFTTVRNEKNRTLLIKAWRQLTSAHYRKELIDSATPFEKELIHSHGREAIAALLMTLAGIATTAYGIKKS
ncbi:MAG: hypothetical protein QG632_510 [Candidatus Dependentiae bacterium]|nr:hypothetical protein [Candidatus Dependentiae bacterium]